MSNRDTLNSRINRNYGQMTKGQKLLANYITDHYDQAVFYTAAKLGDVVGVSESTVVRFAVCLGYKGYPQFQKSLARMVQEKLNDPAPREIAPEKIPRSRILSSVLQSDLNELQKTMEEMDEDAFEIAVESILLARKIYIVGIRTCAPLASFLAFYLNIIFSDVILLTTNNSSELFEQMLHLTEKDVVIGISFPRYSMRTLKAMEFANQRNAKVITLTDSVHSPMNLYSSCNLIAKSTLTATVDSLVAPMSVINALIVSLYSQKQAQVANTLDELEDIWDEYQVYETDELDRVDDSVKMRYRSGGERHE